VGGGGDGEASVGRRRPYRHLRDCGRCGWWWRSLKPRAGTSEIGNLWRLGPLRAGRRSLANGGLRARPAQPFKLVLEAA
jgi:hypothetical protein